MTPSLIGRLQTRLFLLGTVGLAWTILVTPFLPSGPESGLGLGETRTGVLYATTLSALILVTIFGLLWELAYHAAQQLRWEKDWPTLFGLVTGLPEGLLVWAAIRSPMGNGAMADGGVATGATFFVHFTTTWLVVWLVANGPLRVVLLRWRYRGGRVW